MKYYIILEEDDHNCSVVDVITEDNFEQYKQHHLQQFLEKRPISRVTNSPVVLDRTEDFYGMTIQFWEKVTEQEYDAWVEREGFYRGPNYKPITSVALTDFKYQIMEGFNNFKKKK